jgi:two-component system NtrC family sensor kinase
MWETPFVRSSKFLALVAGGVVAALGLLVLAGWHTDSVALVQIGPTVRPMSYSAALCLALGGTGLLALTLGWSRLAAACGVVTAVIGGSILGEYMLGISLGIDQLFMKVSLTGRASYPARMAPNSALALALAGLTILAMSRAKRRDFILLLVGPLGSIALALGLVAFIGYLTGLKTYAWGSFAEMSPQAAFGSLVLGIGIIAFAWHAGATPAATMPHRFAVLIGTGVLAVTLCLWQALIASEEALVGRTVELAVANVHNEIMAQMQSRILALIRLGKRWEMAGKPSRELWEADADLYVSDYHGVQAVSWVDPAFHVQWIVPPESNKAMQGLDLGSAERQRSALELARDSRQVTSTRLLHLVQGGQGFQVYVPLLAGGRFDGFLAGVFRVPDLFDAILANVALRYAIAIYEGEQQIYSRYSPGSKHERQWSRETALGLYGVTWRVRIWPTPGLLDEALSSLPEVVLAVGLFTDVLLVLAIYLAQTARRQATQVDMVNQALQREIGEHTQTEALLAARIKQMEAVRTVTMEITRELDLATLLRLITRRAIDLVEAARSGAVYLWDDVAHVLIPRAWHGRGEWMQQVRINLGEGIVGTVARRQEGILVNDYQRSPYAQPLVVEHFGSTAVIAEPLLYRERLVGVIVLDNRGSSQLFTQEDRELLKFFAAQAAVAIENARLYEAIELRFTRLQTLTRLNQLVSSSLDTGKVLSEIARAAAMLMDAPLVSFWLVDEATRTLEVQAFSDESLGADFPTPRIAFDQGGVGWVAAHRRSLNLPDVFADSRFVGLDWWRAHHFRSFFGLPILHEETLIAVLALIGQTPFRFDPDDQSLLDSFVAQAAVAIRNARFYAEIRARTAHLAQLNAELQNEIGERQRAEEALRASEERFRSVVQSANDAIVLADSEGRIIAWNQGAQAIFGHAEAEVLGQPLTMLMPARYHEAHRQGIARVHHTGHVRLVGKTLEFYGLRRDGREFPLEISLATWQAGGSLFFSGIMRDITERKQAMEQLQRQQEALYQREKLAAMGSLLASVAHELNNPLSVVIMQADLLGLEFKDAALAERIKTISQSAERCVHIVRNFLALARQNPPQRTSVMLNTVVEEALAILAYTLRVDDVEVERQLASDLPPLWADPHQLHQVVVNLLTNAHQALCESGLPRRLTVRTQYHPARRRAVLEVADTGPGIPAPLQERIFEPFFTTKPPGVGTGLGLPFCKGIIEEQGGSLSVVSQPGEGAVFRIELPADTAPPAVATAPAADAPQPVAGQAILVVDDEPGITSALAYLLGRDGHTVQTAANGRLALEKLQAQTYDLILCDLRMPELDGPGFYRELERRYPHLLQRVIFLTGDTLSAEAREFLEKEGKARLNKPFRAAEVRQAIQQALHAR